MNKLIKTIILSFLFFSVSLSATALDSVYKIEVKDFNDKIISRGTGFLVEENQEKYIFTSFHVLNSHLIKARKINAVKENGQIYKDLKIIFYDDTYDLLVLKSDTYIENEGLVFSDKTCSDTSVVGYSGGKKYALSTGVLEDIPERSYLRSLSKYLKAGFSGSPVFDSMAKICGMVVLSSARNSNSVVLNKEFLKRSFYKFLNFSKTISELRKDLNIEYDIFTKEDLKNVLKEIVPGNQVVFNIRGNFSNINLSNVNNIVFISDKKSYVENFSFEESSNVLIENLKIGRVSLNKVNNFSLSSSFLLDSDTLKIVESSNLDIRGNVFLADKPSVSLFYSDFNYNTLSYNKSKNPIEVKNI